MAGLQGGVGGGGHGMGGLLLGALYRGTGLVWGTWYGGLGIGGLVWGAWYGGLGICSVAVWSSWQICLLTL